MMTTRPSRSRRGSAVVHFEASKYACEACGAVRRRRKTDVAGARRQAEARRNSERAHGPRRPTCRTERGDRTVGGAAGFAAARARGRPLLLALPPELARRARGARLGVRRRGAAAWRNAAFLQSIGAQRARRGAGGRVHTARGSVPSALRVWARRGEDNATSRGTLPPAGVRDSRDGVWGHMSRGWRWTFNEATTTLLDAARAPQPGPIDPALLAAASSLPPRAGAARSVPRRRRR